MTRKKEAEKKGLDGSGIINSLKNLVLSVDNEGLISTFWL